MLVNRSPLIYLLAGRKLLDWGHEEFDPEFSALGRAEVQCSFYGQLRVD